MSYGLEQLERTLDSRERELERTYERIVYKLRALDEDKDKADKLRLEVRELKNDIRLLKEQLDT